ncbi:MAG: ACP S-malonyltransferase [Alphaproteobacteria bacterium]|nr:ACP S-malonyltransferase [Alphaproteobacteria bacterium]
MIGAIFPGQGSQHVGMCQDFYEQFSGVRLLFQEIEDTLHFNLHRVMFDGSEEELRATDKAQPALFATSVAIAHVLSQEWGITSNHWSMMAGHSLGEYTALHLSGVLSFTQTLELIKARGQAMATITAGGMIAVIGLSCDVLNGMLADFNQQEVPCHLANDNSPQQGVISAASAHLPLIAQRSRELGAIKSVILNVSGPFHSTMMRGAQDLFTPLLDIMPFCLPVCTVVTNFSGKDQKNPMVIKDHARQQMTNSVLWRQSQLTMAASGLTHVVEIGAGKVLSGLAKKTIPHVQTYVLNSVDGIKQWGVMWQNYLDAAQKEPPLSAVAI